MGLHGISFGSLFLIFLIVMFLFGTKRLRSMGEDLGVALKAFRQALQSDEITKKPESIHDKFPQENNDRKSS